MATYTFADPDAPTSKHMAGVLSFLRMMIDNERAYLAQHPRLTVREREFARGKIHAWQDAVDIINDSGSI